MAMRHTRWVDECCQSLVADMQYPTDALLSAYIACQNLMARINDTLPYDNPDKLGLANEPLLDMSIKAFERELAEVKQAVESAMEGKDCS